MKQSALWLAMLVFSLIMLVWVVFPRAAVAQGILYVPTAQEPAMCVVHDAPPIEGVAGDPLLDVSNGSMSGDGPEIVQAGLGLAPRGTMVLGSSRMGSLGRIELLLRPSQPFVGLHDKVPR